MDISSAMQYGLFLLIVAVLVKPVGSYMLCVFGGECTLLDRFFRPIEKGIYRLCGISPQEDMDWRGYAEAFLMCSLFGTLLLYALLRLQTHLPWFDPVHMTTPMTPDLTINTAVSFSTTTTWQAYGGETTMSYWSQMVGLAAQNFLAGAAGLAVGIAFIRGFARERSGRLGNFWVDMTRATLWILLPLSLIGTLALVWQGVPQNFAPYTNVKTLEGASQTIAQGPIAALEFIKNLGTNGGSFFNVNGAHPYANPTPLTNFLGMLAIAVLPAALTYTFGRMRQGWLLFGVMVALFTAGLALCDHAERQIHPQIAAAHLTGGNMEGKETRFGIGSTVLTAITTSNGATGSYNAMHDSFNPIGGMIPLINMLLGEILFGGLGTGLYSIVMVALIGLFMAGLMVGRTPEYLGKVIGVREVKLIIIYTLAAPAAILILTAIAVVTKAGVEGLTTNTGAHGFTEILYAYASANANNGQNFAGLSANTPFYNITTAIAMFVGRFGLAIPALALAGLLAKQQRRPVTAGTLPTETFLFASVVAGSALLVGGLSYLPALALGPIVEHLQMLGGH